MDYLFHDWDKIKQTLKGRELFIFLDFDGTLAPIIENPRRVFLAKEAQDILKEIADTPGYKLAIVSGRTLEDIKNKIGLKKIVYAGSYGLEIEAFGKELRFILPKGYLQELSRIKKSFKKSLAGIPGILLEDKKVTLSLHYRMVEAKAVPRVKKIFKQVLAPYLKEKIQVRPGKKVLEVFPALNWDKGKAVLWILDQVSSKAGKDFFPVYIGDDISDESAFKVLENKGMGILVGGPKRSRARYYIRDTEETMGFLKKFLEETYARTE